MTTADTKKQLESYRKLLRRLADERPEVLEEMFFNSSPSTEDATAESAPSSSTEASSSPPANASPPSSSEAPPSPPQEAASSRRRKMHKKAIPVQNFTAEELKFYRELPVPPGCHRTCPLPVSTLDREVGTGILPNGFRLEQVFRWHGYDFSVPGFLSSFSRRNILEHALRKYTVRKQPKTPGEFTARVREAFLRLWFEVRNRLRKLYLELEEEIPPHFPAEDIALVLQDLVTQQVSILGSKITYIGWIEVDPSSDLWRWWPGLRFQAYNSPREGEGGEKRVRNPMVDEVRFTYVEGIRFMLPKSNVIPFRRVQRDAAVGVAAVDATNPPKPEEMG